MIAEERTARDEQGRVGILILGFAVIVMVLIAGTVAVTSAHLSRMRLLDVADGAALTAANAFDESSYAAGLGSSVPLSNATVRESAAGYVSSRPLPVGITAWRLESGTGTPDGQTAVVAMSCEATLPMIGSVLRELGVSVRIRVTSSARADLIVP